MFWQRRDPPDRFGDVFRRQGVSVFIGFVCFRVIAFETHVGKLGAAHQARLDVGDANGGAVQIGTQVKAELAHKRFRCAVDVAACIGPASGGGADIDNVATIALNHARQHRAGHIDQPFVVGVDHVFPVFNAGFVRGLHAQRQSGVVDQQINGAPLGRQVSNHLFNGCAVAHVQLCGQDAVT